MKHAEEKHLDRIVDKLRENDEKQRELLVAERLGLNYDYLQRSKKQRDASLLREIQDMKNEQEQEALEAALLRTDPDYLKRDMEKRETELIAGLVGRRVSDYDIRLLEARTKQLSTTILWLAIFMVLSIALFLFAPTAEAQYTDPYTPRPVAQFQPGQEEDCRNHWQDDFHILRAWQSENFYWEGQYNLCAEMLGKGKNYWPSNPTMEKYEVPQTIMQDELDAGRYASFIDSCNAHVDHAHRTEKQFADATHQAHINYCHCRATLGLGACTADFLQRFPYRFQPRLTGGE